MADKPFALTPIERPARTIIHQPKGTMRSAVLTPNEHVAFMDGPALCEYTAYFLGWSYHTQTDARGFIEWEGWCSPTGKKSWHSPREKAIPAPRFNGAKACEVLAACALLDWNPNLRAVSHEGKTLFYLDLEPLAGQSLPVRERVGDAICAAFLVAAWTVQDAAEGTAAPTTTTESEAA